MISKQTLEFMIDTGEIEITAAELTFNKMVLPDERAMANVLLTWAKARVDVARAELDRRVNG